MKVHDFILKIIHDTVPLDITPYELEVYIKRDICNWELHHKVGDMIVNCRTVGAYELLRMGILCARDDIQKAIAQTIEYHKKEIETLEETKTRLVTSLPVDDAQYIADKLQAVIDVLKKGRP